MADDDAIYSGMDWPTKADMQKASKAHLVREVMRLRELAYDFRARAQKADRAARIERDRCKDLERINADRHANLTAARHENDQWAFAFARLARELAAVDREARAPILPDVPF